MLDRSNCKEMWVWDRDNLSNPKENCLKRIVLEILKDGSCLTVRDIDKEQFYKEEAFDTSIFDHCAEIKEPTKRLMTRNEVLGFITHNPHIVVKFYAKVSPSTVYSYNDPVNNYQYASIDEKGNIGDWHKFEVEE